MSCFCMLSGHLFSLLARPYPTSTGISGPSPLGRAPPRATRTKASLLTFLAACPCSTPAQVCFFGPFLLRPVQVVTIPCRRVLDGRNVEFFSRPRPSFLPFTFPPPESLTPLAPESVAPLFAWQLPNVASTGVRAFLSGLLASPAPVCGL